jgi:hypothetical protein
MFQLYVLFADRPAPAVVLHDRDRIVVLEIVFGAAVKTVEEAIAEKEFKET